MKKVEDSIIGGTDARERVDQTVKAATGGTRKIADPPPQPCQDPEHNPAGMIVREPGMYEHVCPQCGNKQIFTVPATYL